MNYLIISYFYAPGATPRALRWSNVAEWLAARGHHVDVVCAAESGLPRDEVRNGVHVHRCNAEMLDRVRGYFKHSTPIPQRLSSSTEKGVPPTDSPLRVRGGVKSRLTAPFRWLFQKLYWPDGGFLWYTPSLNQARTLLRTNHYDAIITVSNYFTAHLVGLRLHRQYPTVRWLADIGDAFSFTDIDPQNNRRLYQRLNRDLERRVLRRADVVSVTTDVLRDKYAELFPESAAKVQVIPPLITVKPVETVKLLSGNVYKLVYAGRLYADIRRPDHLLRLFAALVECTPDKRFELHFYGYNRDVLDAFEPYQALMNSQLFLHGVVDHAVVIEAMRDAAALINIGNKVLYALPSKLVEYASMGKPIINIIHTPQDSSAAFLRPYPALLNILQPSSPAPADAPLRVPEPISNTGLEVPLHSGEGFRVRADFDNQVSALRDFIITPPPIDMQTVRSWLRSFEIDSIGAAYDALLNRITP